jgi:hypothetical protein
MMKEGEDNISDDDEVSFNKKRTREEKEAEDRVSLTVISLKSRGNYRCSKCNVPKKGHICPYQPRFRRRDQTIDGSKSASPPSTFLLFSSLMRLRNPTNFKLFCNRITVTQTVETQCEMDEEMTVRKLPLESQGLLESYLPPR